MKSVTQSVSHDICDFTLPLSMMMSTMDGRGNIRRDPIGASR